jgi:hypothetical protein
VAGWARERRRIRRRGRRARRQLGASPSAARSRRTARGSVTAPRIRRGLPERGQTATRTEPCALCTRTPTTVVSPHRVHADAARCGRGSRTGGRPRPRAGPTPATRPSHRPRPSGEEGWELCRDGPVVICSLRTRFSSTSYSMTCCCWRLTHPARLARSTCKHDLGGLDDASLMSQRSTHGPAQSRSAAWSRSPSCPRTSGSAALALPTAPRLSPNGYIASRVTPIQHCRNRIRSRPVPRARSGTVVAAPWSRAPPV